ncbi:MAG: nickel superoxide dismutase [Myxococcota bacterium]|jgi:nickel superoxide dismutase
MRIAIALMATAVLIPAVASAHCQVPCGIYDDHARVDAMLEDVSTIAKAVSKIGSLAAKRDAQSLNQATRWIHTKEVHASRIITTISEYFLTQKIKVPKAGDKDGLRRYRQQLADHHKVMKLAMKAKQTVDSNVVDDLRKAIQHLAMWWPAPKK